MANKKRVAARWIFTPSDTNKYEVVRGTTDISVIIETPVTYINPPTFEDSLVYTGNVITPTFVGYDENVMTMEGMLRATSAKTYEVVFKLKDGYEWVGGGKSPITVQWTINKAIPTVTINTIKSVVYGTKLSTIIPDYSSNIRGTFEWITTDVEFSSFDIGTHIVKWKFTPLAPDDVANYEVVTSTSNITITAIPLTVPTFANKYTCDGNSFTPVFNGYDETKMTMSGTTSSDTDGTHTVSFDIKDKSKYAWTDGTSNTKNVNYTLSIINAKITSSSKDLIGYNDSITEFSIPKCFMADTARYKVTGIGDAFYKCANLTSITIPNSVTRIYDFAFDGCTSLKSIDMPDTVTHIDSGAFMNCSSLTSIIIPDSVTRIANDTFHGCTSLRSVTMPDGITAISNGAFYDCSSLASINIPDSVVEMGKYAFRGCTSLSELTISNNLKEIPDYAFCGCTSLGMITIPDGVTNIGPYAFYGCCINGTTKLSIPDTVRSIGDYAFAKGFNYVSTLIIPEGLRNIGSYAFHTWSNLNEIKFSTTLETIGNYAFGGVGVKSITIYYESSEENWNKIAIGKEVTPTDVGNENIINALKQGTIIFGKPFTITSSNRSKIGYTGAENETLNIPSYFTDTDGTYYRVTEIGNNAFQNSFNLTSITIPDTITTIGRSSFLYCSSLTSVTIPKSVNKIYGFPLSNCSKLTSVNVDSDNPNFCSVDGVLFNKDKTILFGYPVGKTGSTYTIPTGVHTINDRAFSGCYRLSNITIPPSVVNMGESVFSSCVNLLSIIIPNHISTIYNATFYSCSSLESVTIPGTVTIISNQAFDRCNKLSTVKFIGSKSKWDKIKIGAYNDSLINATKIYQDDQPDEN